MFGADTKKVGSVSAADCDGTNLLTGETPIQAADIRAFKIGILAAMVTPVILYSPQTAFGDFAFWRLCVLLVAIWG